VGFNPLIVAGGGTFIDDILKHAGVENVAERSKAAYPQYSFEKLVEENPPYIIIAKGLVTKGQIEREKRWRGLDAVKEHRILFIDQDIISRPGPRVIYAIEKIADFVYD
jgi:iron complex transport system substrate-binding protein